MRAGTVTPEAVLLELPTAGVATRAFARLIDLLAQAFIGIVAFIVVSLLPIGISPELLVLVVVVVDLLGVPFVMETSSRGRSVGKAMVGLRVVGADGSPVSTRQSAVRAVVGLVDFYMSLGFLAVVTSMFSPTTQRTGDMAAGTSVIRSGSRTSLDVPIAFHPPRGYEQYVASLDVGTLDDEDFSSIRAFLLRVDQLDAAARSGLAAGLAAGVCERLHHRPPAPIDPELLLVCVASAFQQRDGNLLADAALGLAPIAARS
ncbi:MAG: RDD family protein [Actinobacteria bacterium]|nr:RDD family protein [Actinomycetota bacterium]